jgi:hypothetical protein
MQHPRLLDNASPHSQSYFPNTFARFPSYTQEYQMLVTTFLDNLLSGKIDGNDLLEDHQITSDEQIALLCVFLHQKEEINISPVEVSPKTSAKELITKIESYRAGNQWSKSLRSTSRGSKFGFFHHY